MTLAVAGKSERRQVFRVGMVSLGCPKTLVDSETILGHLRETKIEIARSIDECDIALLNTCTFVQDAKEETIEKILELVELKKQKKIQAVVVMGCMVQRYPDTLQKEFSEVDAFVGSGEYHKISSVIDQLKVRRTKPIRLIKNPGYLATAGEFRVALTPRHYRYLKISEGCDHICTFCTIPSFRGKHRSRTMEDIALEAQNLVREGAREIILTGQDTTYYGRDFAGQFLLPALLRQIDKIPNLPWIRLLYAYPSCVTPELIQVFRETSHLCHYLDIPLQHASDAMLAAMKRGITRQRTYDLLKRFREVVPDIAIRTTFIVGFPGETEKDFQTLLKFVSDMQFDRLGVFTYSHEEGTPSAKIEPQVPEEIKAERKEQIMLLQKKISAAHNRGFIGQTVNVLVDEEDKKTGLWIGRTYRDAPEIDGTVRIQSPRPLTAGEFYPVQILSAEEYDLAGKTI